MKKKGFTLIELIAVMAAVAVVMGVAVTLLVQLFDFQKNFYEHSNLSRHGDNLANAFRNDVHTYGKPEILADGNTLLRWKTETEVIDYTRVPGSFPDQLNVVRTVQKDGQQNRYETYRLPDRTTLWCADGKDINAGFVALSLWTAPQGMEKPKIDELNPFDRTIPKSLEQQIDPKYAGNWRTIIARY